tara:strand:- start:465985 stop:466146 length:162 start_codon:yes stop_codon:yes gene_type:complete
MLGRNKFVASYRFFIGELFLHSSGNLSHKRSAASHLQQKKSHHEGGFNIFKQH